MISIIICTSGRLNYLENTIKDLVKINPIIDKIILYSFNDLISVKIIKQKFSNKFKNIIIIYGKNKHELEHRIKSISTIDYKLIKDSKYVWFLSDKDRILANNFTNIKKILQKNINGLTMNVRSLKKHSPDKTNLNIDFDKFELDKGIHKIGLISSNIISTRLFLKYSKKTDLSAYYLGEIIIKIITFESKWYFLKEKIIGYTHSDNDKTKNKLAVSYIDYRLDQEFKFYMKKINIYIKNKSQKFKNKIIFKAFIKNIISWISLLKEKDNPITFRKKIKNYKHYFKNYLSIKLIIFFLTYCPLLAIKIIKRIR
jgi:hypothetical protein